MGNIVVIVFALIVVIGAVVVAFVYGGKRKEAKSDVAVSGSAKIVAIAGLYFSLFAVNWPMVAIVKIGGGNAKELLDALSPNLTVTISGVIITIVLCYLVYRISLKELQSNRFAINASAFELEELGKSGGVFELAYAHLRYRLAGRKDVPLGRPGEDPYKLPLLAQDVDWVALAAGMLVQLEPHLDLETFQFISERRFFTLMETDAFDETKRKFWIVRATIGLSSMTDILEDFDRTVVALTALPNDYCWVICVRDNFPCNKMVTTPSGYNVRVLSERSLIEESLDFSQYAETVVRRFEQRQIPGTNYTLKDCFVSPRAREIQGGEIGSAAGSTVDLLSELGSWAIKPGVDHMSIIGEYGQGKSTAVLAYCAKWAHHWRNGTPLDRVPLLIELRGKSPKRQSQDAFLSEWGSRFGLSGAALLNLIKSGRAILIFEGFDEVQDAGMRFDRFEQFKALWSFSYPGSKIIFTGRPNFFLDTRERQQLLRNSAEAALSGLANSRTFMLSFLSQDEMQVALQKVSPDVRNEIICHCSLDASFASIASRPSMLPVIGTLWANGSFSKSEPGQLTSASIIRLFIDFLYGRKEADLDKLGEYQLLHRSVRHFFTQRVALRMVADGLKNTIDLSRFNSAIDQAYADLDLKFRMEHDSDLQVANSIRELRTRFKEKPDSELRAAIATDVRTNGLFAPDPAGGRDNLYFPHKQYFEYTLGELVASYFEFSEDLRSLRPSAGTVAKCIELEPVCLFFASGLVSADFQPKRRVWDFLTLALYSYVRVLEHVSRPSTLISVLKSCAFKGRYELLPVNSLAGVLNKAELLCPVKYRLVSNGPNNSALVFSLSLSAFFACQTLTLAIDRFTVQSTLTKPVATISNHNFYSSFLQTFLTGHDATFLWLSLLLATGASGGAFSLSMRNNPGFRNRSSGFFLEIYRHGCIRAATREYGEVTNAAILIAAQEALPPQAIPFKKEMLTRAQSLLGYMDVAKT